MLLTQSTQDFMCKVSNAFKTAWNQKSGVDSYAQFGVFLDSCTKINALCNYLV